MDNYGSKGLDRGPDCEIVVRMAGFQIFTGAFYASRRNNEVVEAVTEIFNREDSDALISLLQICIDQIRSNEWWTLDELGAGAPENENDLPF